jgi:parvulin-like peptidyl-prolyl isomerase
MRKSVITLCLTFLCCVCISCKEKPASISNNIATKPGNQKPLAQVGDKVLTAERFKKEFALSGKPDTKEERQILLDELVTRLKLLHLASKAKFDRDPLILREMEDILIQKIVDKEFEERRRKQPRLDPEALQEYYDTHQHELVDPARIQIALIFVAVTDDSTRVDKRIRMGEALTAIKNAKLAPAKNFGEIARTYSDDALSLDKGGSIPTLYENAPEKCPYPSKVFEASFQLKKAGDISDIVETADGFYLLKATQRIQSHPRSFDSVKELIRARLTKAARENFENNIQKIATANVPADIDLELLDSLVLDKPKGQTIPR